MIWHKMTVHDISWNNHMVKYRFFVKTRFFTWRSMKTRFLSCDMLFYRFLAVMVYIYTTPGASQYWNVATKETHRSSNVSMAPTSSSGRMTVVGMLLSGSRHQSSRSTVMWDSLRRCDLVSRCFEVCMFCCSKIRMKCTSYLCTPIAKHLLSSRKIPAYGWWAGQSSIRCVRLKADKA